MIDQKTNEFTAEQQSVIERILRRLATGANRARIAWVAGLEDGVLDRLLAGEGATPYGFRNDYATAEAIEALAQWLEASEEAAENDDGYAITPTFQYLQTLFSHAHQGRLLLAITGSWGVGKTEAAKYYAATHPRTHSQPGAIRVQFDPTDNKPSAALEKIREALNAKAGAYRNGNLMYAIGAALRPGDFLILEECQRLEGALDIICSLYDDFGVGIAMIGNPDLSAGVWGKKTTFGTLASRANRFDFPACTREDVDAWLAWKGLPTGLTIAQREALAEAAATIAARPGQNSGLRALAHTFRVSEQMYPGELLTGDLLIQIANTIKPRQQ